MSSVASNKQEPREAIQHLPESTLLHLARNESAQHDFRIAAVELLIENQFPSANHPELILMAAEIRRRSEAKAEVTAIVESATEESLGDDATDHGVIDGWKAAAQTTKKWMSTDSPVYKAFASGPFKASVTTETMQKNEGE